ncbi:MAG: DUF3298 domain-containing protein [Bacteroidaceae bacterium]|nr:DUF3298 domain-containing protein [Bacteroidaceae bacterium]
MKKCATYLFFSLMFLLASCGGSNSASTEKNSDTFVLETIKNVCLLDSSSSNSPKYECNIAIHVMKSDDKARQDKVNSSILYTIFGFEGSNIQVAIDSFIDIMHSEYRDIRPEYLNEKHINENPPYFNFNYDIETSVSYGRGGAINYGVYCKSSNGTSTVNTIYTHINYNPATGDEIKLCDVFKDNIEEYLCSRLTDALADKIGAGSRKEIKEKGYLLFNDIYPTENFILKEDSIVFVFNNYDISSYTQGCTSLGFSYEELSDILK